MVKQYFFQCIFIEKKKNSGICAAVRLSNEPGLLCLKISVPIPNGNKVQ